jgi:hypothetical protein
MLYNMLYMMLCNMIHNVLHNMLCAKNPPSHFPLPGTGSASLQCLFIQQLLVGLLMIERHMLQMMLFNMLCNLLYNHWEMFYTGNVM